MTPDGDVPTAQAQAIMERVLGLVRECRLVLHALEHPPKPGESSGAEAERILYFTLMSAIDAGLIRTMEDAVKVLSHASQPLGPMALNGWSGRSRRCRKGVTSDSRFVQADSMRHAGRRAEAQCFCAGLLGARRIP